MIVCYQCGQEVELEGKVMRKDTCPSCHSFLHCCLNCRFYERSAHNECREPAAEWVSSKDAANFCEFFEPREEGPDSGGAAGTASGHDAFENLFKR